MADKIAYQDPTMQIMQFLQGMMGTKQTTSGTGTSTTSIPPEFLQALQTVFASQMGNLTPEGITQLISGVYREGSKLAPGLATQFGQAAGARTSGNSVLAYNNNQLQAQLAAEAMKQILTAQAQASQTATQIAANAPKTTTESKSQTSNTQPGNRAISLLPFLLANASKLKGAAGGLSDFFGGSDAGGTLHSGLTMDGVALNNPSMYVAPEVVGGLDFGNIGIDVGGSGFDYGNLGGLADFDLGALTGALDGFGTGADFGNLDLGLFFANGGMLGPAGGGGGSGGGHTVTPSTRPAAQPFPLQSKQMPNTLVDWLREGLIANAQKFAYANGGRVGSMSVAKKAPGYANGGMPGTDAINYPVDTITSNGDVTDTGSTAVDPANPYGISSNDLFAEQLGQDVVDYFANITSGASAGSSGWSPNMSTSFVGADGFLYSGFSDIPMGQGEAFAGQAQSPITGIRRISGTQGHGNDATDDAWRGDNLAAKVDLMFNPDGSFNSVLANRDDQSGTAGLLSAVISAIGLATGNPALAFARTVGTRTGMSFLQDKLQPTVPQPQPQASSSNQYADGGGIRGPGTGTSDSIPVKVSDGEYIISADVVDILGPEFFDTLQKVYHTPVATHG